MKHAESIAIPMIRNVFFLVVRMAQVGQLRVSDMAQAIGRHETTIHRWLKAYRDGGIDLLLQRDNGHRKPTLNDADQQALKQELKKGRFKSAKEVRVWLAEQRNCTLTIAGTYYWLSQVNARPKMPRKQHHQQDSNEVEHFKGEAINKLMELDIPFDKPIRIWIQDEHRYGLISTVRRCWTLKGHRSTTPVGMKFDWGYVYGAAEVITGALECWYMPTVSLGDLRQFLFHLVHTEPDAVHVVFWDQAGFHPSAGDGQIPNQVRLIPLPPYSPELNAIESLWAVVKGHVSNTVWKTLESIEEAMTQVLREFWELPKRVWSLLGDSWLTRTVRSFLELRNAAIIN